MNRKSKEPIAVTVCQTAYGWVGIAWSERGLVAMSLPRASEAEALEQLPAGSEAAPNTPAGKAAIVKIELRIEGKHKYTDYLSLYKFGEGWKIVSKIYCDHDEL